MYGFIYCTQNLINGKKYIGKKTFDKLGEWKRYLGSGKLLLQAIKKYGKENFKRQILYYCESLEELNQMEIYFIDKLNAVERKDYYNIASGGDGGVLTDINPFYGKNHTEEIKKIMCERHNKIRVRCVETGEIFESTRDAERKTGINHMQISKCCRHLKRFQTAGGFHWEIEEFVKGTPPPTKSGNKRAVICVETGIIYESIRDATIQTGIRLSSVLSGICNTAGGFHWQYYDNKTNDNVA